MKISHIFIITLFTAHLIIDLSLLFQVKASDEMYFPCCLAVLGAIPTEDPRSSNSLNSSNSLSSSSKSLSSHLSTPLITTAAATATTAIQECSAINEKIIADTTEKTKNETENKNKSDTDNKNGNENGKESEYDIKLKKKIIKLDYVSSRQMTYCVWGQGDKNPKTFSTLTPDIVTAANLQKSIFLRKFVLPSNNHNNHDYDKRQDHNNKRRNETSAFTEYKNEVKSFEVEKRTLLCAWLTLVLKIKDTCDKKVTENTDNGNINEYDDSNDKIIEETSVSAEVNNIIDEDLTDKEINIDKENKETNSSEDMIFDFNYCLQKSDFYSIQNKEMIDLYRKEKYEKYKIDNENRDRQNYNDSYSYEQSSTGCDRYGRSASRHHDDNGRDNQGPEPWGTNNNSSRGNYNNNNDYNRIYNKNDRRSSDRRSRGRGGDRERYDNYNDNNSERYDKDQSESNNKKRKVDNE